MTIRYRLPLRCLSLVIGVACSGIGVASAQQPIAATSAEPPPPSPGDVAQAREEFTLGATLAHRGDWLDALAAFERSDQLRPHPITVYNIGYCERALGRYTRAWKAFRRALADNQAKRGGTMPPAMVEQTREYIKEVEGRLARAFVTIDQDGVELSVNGRPLELVEDGPGKERVLVAGTRAPGRPEAAPGKTFEVLLDPGNQVFLLEHNSMQATVVDRSFEAGSSTSFRLHIRPPAPTGDTGEKSTAKRQPDYTWPTVAWGVGATGLVTGTIFGLATFKKRSQLRSECVDVCPKPSQGDIDAMNRYATISDIGFGVALAGAGVGTWLFLRERSKTTAEERARSSRRVHVWVGLGSIGARGRF